MSFLNMYLSDLDTPQLPKRDNLPGSLALVADHRKGSENKAPVENNY